MDLNERQSNVVARARQLLESSVDANPVTTAELWDLLGRYRRALADLLAAPGLNARRLPACDEGSWIWNGANRGNKSKVGLPRGDYYWFV
jgi:hypothetical protein